MLSKNETFKPPEEHEAWTNNEFSNVMDYVSEQKIAFNGSIFVEWLAVPYISIWFARSTKYEGFRVWVIHNLEFTDYILSDDIDSPRDVILAFAEKWGSDDLKTLRRRDISKTEEKSDFVLKNHIQMLENVGNDEELWVKE